MFLYQILDSLEVLYKVDWCFLLYKKNGLIANGKTNKHRE